MRFAAYAMLFLACLPFPAAGAPVSGSPSLEAGDWPQYRGDAGRSGYTPETLPSGLTLAWKYEQEKPSPAWRTMQSRMDFDYAPQPVVGGGKLFFGSSTDCRVYALDAATGREIWSFYTDAPVRFAPALWKDMLFAAGDDGYLYCLSARDGKLLWKKSGGPESGMVLGNDRLVSRYPLRGGPVIHRDVLYYGAGIWPSEGIFIRALDLNTGKERWVNDDSGGMEWDQPHPGARAKSGISAQGYLAAAGDKLLVPTGRAVPAALNLSDGALRYFHLQEYRNYGGSRLSANDRMFFAVGGNTRFERETIGSANAFFNLRTGALETTDQLSSPAMAFTPSHLFSFEPRNHCVIVRRFDGLFTEKTGANAKGEPEKRSFLAAPEWTLDIRQPDAITMIVAGNTLVVGSPHRKITLVDISRRAVTWTGDVDGVPYGLAAARGRLYVSTDTGSIYCFGGGETARPSIVRKTPDNNPYGPNESYARAAEEIINAAGITEGYCLDLGCGNGGLAYELARRTNLTIYAIDADPANVEAARKRFSAAGLYGTRVTVHRGDPARTGYPAYFANLIVSGRSAAGETYRPTAAEITRLQRPWGGVIVTGAPGAMEKRVRGELSGGGDWTHQYHDPANTITSGDEIVRGPLGILWFRDPDLETPSRHGRNVSPLFSRGRMFVQGTDGVRAYDAYNGRALWEYPLEDLMKPYDQEHLTGVATTGSNWCTDGDRVYLHHTGAMTHNGARSCLVLDAASGNRIAEYPVPTGAEGKSASVYTNSDRYWGFIAVAEGILYGSIVNHEHITAWAYLESDMNRLYSESDALFALDAATGKVKWMYKAQHSIRHNSIAIGGGKVFFIDRPLAAFDHLRNPHRKGEHAEGKLVALDAATGKTAYALDRDIYGTLLAFSREHDILLMTYQYTRFRLPSEIGGRMTAFRASDGSRLWDTALAKDPNLKYSSLSRPLINGRTIYLEPQAYDLLSGKLLDFTMQRSYGCGIVAGSKNMLVFRSATFGYIDLTGPEKELRNIGGIRPGCWINTLPVGGIVLMPDYTYRCDCSYLTKATVAFQPLEIK